MHNNHDPRLIQAGIVILLCRFTLQVVFAEHHPDLFPRYSTSNSLGTLTKLSYPFAVMHTVSSMRTPNAPGR